MEFAYITDPGHGWLLVTVQQAAELSLHPSDFSKYSYRMGDVLALEEDCDMALFLNAYEAHNHGVPLIRAKHVDHDAPMRSWERL